MTSLIALNAGQVQLSIILGGILIKRRVDSSRYIPRERGIPREFPFSWKKGGVVSYAPIPRRGPGNRRRNNAPLRVQLARHLRQNCGASRIARLHLAANRRSLQKKAYRLSARRWRAMAKKLLAKKNWPLLQFVGRWHYQRKGRSDAPLLPLYKKQVL